MSIETSQPGTKRFQRIENFLQSPFEQDLMVMHVETRETIVLNFTANAVWEALEWPQTIGDLSNLLLEAFPEQSRETLERQVEGVLKTLQSRGLIVRATAS